MSTAKRVPAINRFAYHEVRSTEAKRVRWVLNWQYSDLQVF